MLPALPSRALDFRTIARRLGEGKLVVDRIFDELYPIDIRAASPVHWTPIEVAMRVVQLLDLKPNETLLDLGAGVGKFCIVAAAVNPHIHVRGVEHRERLVAVARQAAAQIGVEVDIQHGSVSDLDFSAWHPDALYLYNPFEENRLHTAFHIDDSVELSEARFQRDVRSVKQLLRKVRIGTRVATHFGFGGRIPDGYRLLHRGYCAGTVELWKKESMAEDT